MKPSPTYTALDAMMRKNWIWISCAQLRNMLDKLDAEGAITAKEHEALLALADEIKPCFPLDGASKE